MSYQIDYDQTVRIGVVGVGSHCYRNILPVLTYLPVRLVAVCDVDASRAEAVGNQYGAAAYSEPSGMYESEQLDAVLIAVSPYLHPDLAIEAFQHGLHVWVEKPPAPSVEALRQMIVHRDEQIAMVGVKKAFMPATQKAVELVGWNSDTTLISALGVYEVSVPRSTDDTSSVVARGWLDNFSHPLSVLVGVVGPVSSVRTIRGKRGGGVLVLDHVNGAIANLHLAQGTPQSQPSERYSFFGEGLTVDIINCSKVALQRGIPFEYTTTDTFAPVGLDHGATVWEAQHSFSTLENKSAFLQGMYHELLSFCEWILNGKIPRVGTLEFALHLTDIFEAAVRSDGEVESLTTEPTHATS